MLNDLRRRRRVECEVELVDGDAGLCNVKVEVKLGQRAGEEGDIHSSSLRCGQRGEGWAEGGLEGSEEKRYVQWNLSIEDTLGTLRKVSMIPLY